MSFLGVRGSTRAVALIRIGLALLLWARWGADLTPLHAHVRHAGALGAAFWLFTSAMLVGLRSGLATAGAGLTALALVHVAGVEEYTHHHSYLLAAATCLLALAPCGGSFSVDRWLAVRDARTRGEPPPPEQGDLWAAWLLAAQLSAVYFWSAVSQLTPAFLSGERLQQTYVALYSPSDCPHFPAFAPLMMALALAVVALELALAFGLWNRRARRWLMPAGLAFHAALYLTVPVLTLSATMVLLYLAFLPDEVHRAVDALVGTS